MNKNDTPLTKAALCCVGARRKLTEELVACVEREFEVGEYLVGDPDEDDLREAHHMISEAQRIIENVQRRRAERTR